MDMYNSMADTRSSVRFVLDSNINSFSQFMEALKKAGLEMLRVIVIAIIPILIDSLANNEVDWRLVGITGAIAGLRFADKWLHALGKETGNDKLLKGLTRF